MSWVVYCTGVKRSLFFWTRTRTWWWFVEEILHLPNPNNPINMLICPQVLSLTRRSPSQICKYCNLCQNHCFGCNFRIKYSFFFCTKCHSLVHQVSVKIRVGPPQIVHHVPVFLTNTHLINLALHICYYCNWFLVHCIWTLHNPSFQCWRLVLSGSYLLWFFCAI